MKSITFQHALIAFFFFTQVNLACGAVVTLQPLKDNTIYEDSTGSVSNGQGGSIFVGKTGEFDGFHLRRGLLAFNIAGSIPAGSIISNVTLTMFLAQSSPDPAPVTVTLHAALKDWGEGASSGGGTGGPAMAGDATWIHNFFNTSSWTNPGGDFRTNISAAETVDLASRDYEWTGGTMVSDVQGWLNSPGTNFGWFIVGDELRNKSAQRFVSGEGGATGPRLTITYTIPEPTAAILGFAGVLPLVSRRRRNSVR